MLTWREKKGFSKAPDAATFSKGGDSHPEQTRTIVFIRHGESDWNEVFNKEKIMLLPRAFLGCLREWNPLGKCCKAQDSVYLDSPLSIEGCEQADGLRDYLFRRGDPSSNTSVKVAREGSPDDSVVVSSNLRRALHTGLIALHPRLERNAGEKVLLLAELQEMSRNVDTNSITSANKCPELGIVARRLGSSHPKPETWVNSQYNTGNKKMCTSALPRFNDFCSWCFDNNDKPVIIVGAGHSLWFMNFFKLFLPQASKHDAKSCKLYNCAAVSFTLVSVVDYIEPNSHFLSFCWRHMLILLDTYLAFPIFIPQRLTHLLLPYPCQLSYKKVRGIDPKTNQSGFYVREESIKEDYPLNAALKRKRKSKGGKAKKLFALFSVFVLLLSGAWFAGVFEETRNLQGGQGEDGSAEQPGTPGAFSAVLKVSGAICSTGMTGARVLGVAGSVSSLVGAGLYTCVGENGPAGKLGVVAFYSFLLYLMSTRLDLGLCASILPVV